MNIAEKIQEQRSKLFEELKNKSKVLITNEEYDNEEDLIYEMPRIYIVTKHSFYVEYVILEIQEGGILKCGGLGEDFGELITTDISELTTDDACGLFNHI
jgi:hypothetical protein